jgi:uncharacterized protein YraI
MLRFVVRILLMAVIFAALIGPIHAQSDELVASLDVLATGVQVKRIDTANWVNVKVETLIGEGDSVRTDGTGRARITFFEDGTSTELEPGTEFQISTFRGSEERFSLSVAILAGVTRQQFGRLVDSGSTYEVETPGATMTVRGTDFAVRVEDSGRSSVLTYDGLVDAAATTGNTSADIPPGFGVRVAIGEAVSDVVPAATFDELDAALDGCPGAFETDADVRLNVRLGPATVFQQVGTISPADIDNLIGVSASGGWYRIPFRGGYGWVSAASMSVDVGATCAGLPQYPDTRTEDPARYALIGDTEVIARVIAETANLRTGPGTSYPLVSSVPGGTEMVIIGRNADASWLRVQLSGERVAWVASFLVEVNADLTTVGVIPTEEVPPTPDVTPGPTPESGGAGA